MSEPYPEIEGIWQMVRAELAGEAAPDSMAEQTELELRAGAYAVRFAGHESDRGHYEIGERIGFETLVFKGEGGTNAGRTMACIFQIKGDRLRICYGLDGILPNGFSTAGERSYSATYKRVSRPASDVPPKSGSSPK